MTADPLSAYRDISEAPERYATANVTELDPGDVRALDLLFPVNWARVRRRLAEVRDQRRTHCAVCGVTFVGDRCERCGIRRRGR